MARVRKPVLAFDAITLEGSLISPGKLAEVAARKTTEQTDADYRIPKGLTLKDETARYFRIGQALFRELFAGAHPSHQATTRFTQELLREVFGFADIQPVTAPKAHGDRTFILSLEALGGRVPFVVVPPADDLDHASSTLSPTSIAARPPLRCRTGSMPRMTRSGGCAATASTSVWLRDNASLTRPAYLEANLRQIFEAEDFAGFAALWLHSPRQPLRTPRLAP